MASRAATSPFPLPANDAAPTASPFALLTSPSNPASQTPSPYGLPITSSTPNREMSLIQGNEILVRQNQELLEEHNRLAQKNFSQAITISSLQGRLTAALEENSRLRALVSVLLPRESLPLPNSQLSSVPTQAVNESGTHQEVPFSLSNSSSTAQSIQQLDQEDVARASQGPALDHDQSSQEKPENFSPPLPNPSSSSSHSSSYGPIRRASQSVEKRVSREDRTFILNLENLVSFFTTTSTLVSIISEDPNRKYRPLSVQNGQIQLLEKNQSKSSNTVLKNPEKCVTVIDTNNSEKLYLLFEQSMNVYFLFKNVKKASRYFSGDLLSNGELAYIENKKISLVFSLEKIRLFFPVTERILGQYFDQGSLNLVSIKRGFSKRLSTASGIELRALPRETREKTFITTFEPKLEQRNIK